MGVALGSLWGHFGVTLGPVWDHFWHSKVILDAFRGHFEVTLSISTSNFMCDACVMHTCTGLVGPKTGNVKELFVFTTIFEGSKGARGRQPNEQVSEPDRLGGG